MVLGIHDDTKMKTSADAASDRSPSPTNESLPPHTSEIGTLKKLPNHSTAWLGSSSGVFFVNTVRRAFSAAFSGSAQGHQPVPASEDILTGEVDSANDCNGPVIEGPSTTAGFDYALLTSLGSLPDRNTAMELVVKFFKAWHPLFPFLHGPTFLADVDAIYQASTEVHSTVTRPRHPRASDVRKRVTLQLIINISSLDQASVSLPLESRIKSTADVTRVAGILALNHDIETIQALLAAELYLVATVAVKQASTVAGMTLKLIYHSGLHRCPLRYAQLSADECEIRKRIFWSAYALDRHLSISLGDPITIQDSDIDVCLSGRELHKPVSPELLRNVGAEIKYHMPYPVPTHDQGSPEDPRVAQDTPEGRDRAQREAAITAYVHYSRLTGRIVEIFHKSIHARFPRKDDITYLNSDIETWWNDLPSFLSGENTSETTASQQQLSPFFAILYQQLQFLLNRPSLSLEPGSADFQHGLQVCIKASRATLASLKLHKAQEQTMLLPGLLSANWMAGLVVAFACTIGKYPKSRACLDIETSLKLLDDINSKTTKHCHHALSLFLANIRSRRASAGGFLVMRVSESNTPTEPVDVKAPEDRSSKRRKTTRSSTSINDATALRDASNNSSPDNVLQKSQNTPLRVSGDPETTAPTFTPTVSSEVLPQNFTADSVGPSNMLSMNSAYGEPSIPTFYDPNMYLPELPIDNGDPLLWQNFDFNMADVFGSATWENLITGGASNIGASGWDQLFGRERTATTSPKFPE